jgi:hypothetical protein
LISTILLLSTGVVGASEVEAAIDTGRPALGAAGFGLTMAGGGPAGREAAAEGIRRCLLFLFRRNCDASTAMINDEDTKTE